MFFILSKILVVLLSPTLWILILFITGLSTKKPKLRKYAFRVSLVLFIVFSNGFLFNQFAKMWDVPAASLPASKTYSCAIVLGGFGSEDAERNGYFNLAADRFIQAIKLKMSGKASHLLISGGNGQLFPTGFRESDWVLRELRDIKLADSSVLIENRSRNSYENALYSKQLLESENLKPPYLLITSAYHMRRAMYTYKKLGVEIVPFPCNYFAGRGATTFSDFIPRAMVLSGWEIYIKEVVGYAVYFFKK
jgi:uncharacterized SAM-binding protein YcdF (DUF218 family)